MIRQIAAFLLLCSMNGAALARVVTYSAKAGDTPESIAADYYGNRSLALFISEGNGLQHDAKLKPGQKIHIPTAFHYRVKRGDTLEALAQKFCDDKRRAPFLAQFSGIKSTDKLREGQDLLIPFQHVHHADAPESLASVARAFYGDPGKAKLLADFNFRSSPMLAKGDKLLVPIGHVKIRAVRLQAPRAPTAKTKAPAPAPELAAAPAVEAQKREEELAQRIGAQLQVVEKAYKDGSYSDVPGALDKLLTDDPSEAQLAEIFRLKAFAYVALGMDELAVNAFREVLERKPDVTLDEATVSPKIRAAFDRARRAPAP
ncbi:MAG TPA: LysM peptidoglycan-binding domain-containing protein [Polyangia bacterium]|nr:LysM peptidoglycan-binding domain-containing protein [Polyangia bacterium]